jgi:Glycogen recognition site of AMP-activated protein kinase
MSDEENGNDSPVSGEATGNAEAFGPPRVLGGRLVFVYREDAARRVRVSGEFNGWNPAHGVFARQPDGTWRLEIDPPAAGRYRYRFLVDDTRWIEDPSNDVREANPYGSMDSVLVIEPGD